MTSKQQDTIPNDVIHDAVFRGIKGVIEFYKNTARNPTPEEVEEILKGSVSDGTASRDFKSPIHRLKRELRVDHRARARTCVKDDLYEIRIKMRVSSRIYNISNRATIDVYNQYGRHISRIRDTDTIDKITRASEKGMHEIREVQGFCPRESLPSYDDVLLAYDTDDEKWDNCVPYYRVKIDLPYSDVLKHSSEEALDNFSSRTKYGKDLLRRVKRLRELDISEIISGSRERGWLDGAVRMGEIMLEKPKQKRKRKKIT